MRRAGVVCASAVLSLTATPATSAQTIWTPIKHRLSLQVEALHPHLKPRPGVAVSAFSGAVFMTGTLPVAQHGMLIVELPFARSSIASAGESRSNSAFGNPYIGFQISDGDSSGGFVGELGIRPSLVGANGSEAQVIGTFSDLDRQEAFGNSVTTISGAWNLYAQKSETSGRVRVGLSERILGQDFVDYETMLDYGALGAVDASRVRLAGALTGRLALTEGGSLGDRTFHQAAMSASMAFDQLRPGLFVRVPFDKDVRDVVSSTFGITLEYTFR